MVFVRVFRSATIAPDMVVENNVPLINPVEIVHMTPVWGEVSAGVLIDHLGDQHHFLTESSREATGRVTVNYQALPPESLVWIDKIYDY
jgi:hypothetical protein